MNADEYMSLAATAPAGLARASSVDPILNSVVTVLLLGTADIPDVGDADVVVGRFPSWSPNAQSWFDAQLAEAVVGWRCILVGSEVDVATARDLARRAGAVDEEITTVMTSSAVRRVYCASCASVTTAATPIVGCAGCGSKLTVGEHFSPRLSAFLGTP